MSHKAPKQIFQLSLLRRVFSFVRPYQRVFLVSVFLSLLLAFTTPLRPYLIQATVNLAVGKTVQLQIGRAHV